MSYSGATRLTAYLCGVFAIVFVDVANAEMCKWIDEDGCVHYAETCPEGVESIRVEILAPPTQEQVDEANRSTPELPALQSGKEELSAESTVLSTFKINQMTDRCIKARLNLEALSQSLPVYYDKLGQLQAEYHQSVQFDRSGSYLNADMVKRANEHWTLVEKDNCTVAVSRSKVNRGIRQKQKEHQQQLCDFWRTELEYMERNKSFHDKRLDLKTMFNAKCK